MMLFDSLSFQQLVWLTPFFFALHNLEEAPGMARWSRQIPLRIHPLVTTRQFAIAVALLTGLCFVVAFVVTANPQNRLGVHIMLGFQTAMLLNAFIPHLAATIWFRMYAPGVVTGILLNVPFGIYLIQRAFAENQVESNAFVIAVIIASLTMIALAALSLEIGKWVETKTGDRRENTR
jgi:hypothetical protein